MTMFTSGSASAPRTPAVLWSLPHILTYGRIVAIPLVLGCLFASDAFWMRWVAFWIYAAAAVTDFLDGYLARIWKQQSSIGKMLDPIADKLLVAGCLLMLCADGTIKSWSLWAAIVILSRAILVSGLRELLAELHVSMPVSAVAKWKTTVQLLALGFLIVGPAGERVLPGNVYIGLTLLWMSAGLTLYTGWDYLKAGLRYFVDEQGPK